jgi:hypothetical protein
MVAEVAYLPVSNEKEKVKKGNIRLDLLRFSA